MAHKTTQRVRCIFKIFDMRAIDYTPPLTVMLGGGIRSYVRHALWVCARLHDESRSSPHAL